MWWTDSQLKFIQLNTGSVCVFLMGLYFKNHLSVLLCHLPRFSIQFPWQPDLLLTEHLWEQLSWGRFTANILFSWSSSHQTCFRTQEHLLVMAPERKYIAGPKMCGHPSVCSCNIFSQIRFWSVFTFRHQNRTLEVSPVWMLRPVKFFNSKLGEKGLCWLSLLALMYKQTQLAGGTLSRYRNTFPSGANSQWWILDRNKMNTWMITLLPMLKWTRLLWSPSASHRYLTYWKLLSCWHQILCL